MVLGQKSLLTKLLSWLARNRATLLRPSHLLCWTPQMTPDHLGLKVGMGIKAPTYKLSSISCIMQPEVVQSMQTYGTDRMKTITTIFTCSWTCILLWLSYCYLICHSFTVSLCNKTVLYMQIHPLPVTNDYNYLSVSPHVLRCHLRDTQLQRMSKFTSWACAHENQHTKEWGNSMQGQHQCNCNLNKHWSTVLRDP